MKASSVLGGAALLMLAVLAASPGLAGTEDDFGFSRLVQREALEESSAEDEALITLITGDWVDVREILKTVARSGGYGLQIAPDVEGMVNVHLENVSVGTALRSLLEPVDLGYELVDGVLMVYKHGLVTRWFSFDYPVTSREGRGELRISGRGQVSGGDGGGEGSDQNESHVTSSAKMDIWPEIVSSLQTMVFGAQTESSGEGDQLSVSLADGEGRSLVVSPMAGVIQATAEWKRLRQVEVYLGRMRDSLRRQVAIEVKILEVALTDEERTGVDWSAVGESGASSFSMEQATTEALTNPFFKFVVSGKSVSGLIEAVEKQGTVKVISTPRITTLNNQKAVVRIVTEEVFYQAQVEPPIVTSGVTTEAVIAYIANYIPVGFVLDVTPQVGRDEVITLNVHPTITDIVRIESSPNDDTAPVLSVRELDTVGKVRDGETLVIAGFISTGLNDQEQGVPILKDIPLLGYFFKRKVKKEVSTEMVMLLTPVILNEDRSAAWAEEAESSVKGKM
jgi:MSHA biogenesis protein MshL